MPLGHTVGRGATIRRRADGHSHVFCLAALRELTILFL